MLKYYYYGNKFRTDFPNYGILIEKSFLAAIDRYSTMKKSTVLFATATHNADNASVKSDIFQFLNQNNYQI